MISDPSESIRPRPEEVPPQELIGDKAPDQLMADAAEMLWAVLANVGGGDWSKQTPEWRESAARWRDNYFKALESRKAQVSA